VVAAPVDNPRHGTHQPLDQHRATRQRSSMRGFGRTMKPPRDEAERLAQFIQICASQNDLFALDGEGNVYQYNFNATTWEKLAASRSHEGPKRSNHTRVADTERPPRKM
jgi:hypothetical protein